MDPIYPPKPWWKRTELWLSVASSTVGALVATSAAGPLTIGTAAAPVAGALLKLFGISFPIAAYTLSRGVAKMGSGN